MVIISDISKQAGVSVSTVSKVLNNNTKISPDTRDRVLKVVDEMGYVPDEAARKLRLGVRSRKRLTSNVGVIACGRHIFRNPYYTELLEALGEELVRRNYHMEFAYASWMLLANPTLFSKVIHSANIDGLILLNTSGADHTLYEKIEGRANAVISVAGEFVEGMDSVCVDHFRAGTDMVDYLAGLGHVRIGFVGDCNDMKGMYGGYREGLRKNSLDYDGTMAAGDSYGGSDFLSGMEKGGEYMKKVMTAGNKLPTAVIAAKDTMAIGAVNAVREKGLKVPEDISVTGFGDLDSARGFTPGITTVGFNEKETARLSVSRLLERVESPWLKPVSITVSHEIVRRESCLQNKKP